MKKAQGGRVGGAFAGAARSRYWREQEARVVLEEWARSGLELVEFARRHELHPGRLRRWSERLKPKRELSFHAVELSFEGLARREAVSDDAGVAVVLRGGRRVAVGPNFDEELLARVVRVMESWPC